MSEFIALSSKKLLTKTSTMLSRRKRRYCTFTRITVAGITVLADAVVAAGSVHARGVLITLVMTSRALVQLGAIVLVDSMVTRKTLARIRADHVDASRVCVTMMTVRSTLLLALVHI